MIIPDGGNDDYEDTTEAAAAAAAAADDDDGITYFNTTAFSLPKIRGSNLA